MRPQLPIDVVERELRHFEQHQPPRCQPHDLAAQLRADRAAAAGDQHRLALDAGLEEVWTGAHRVAAQEVGDGDFLELVDARSAGDEVGDPGHRLHVHAERHELREDLPPAAARQRGHREQHPVAAGIPEERGQAIRRVHLEPGDDGPPQRTVVVDERDRREVAAGRKRRRELSAAGTGAVDEDTGSPVAVGEQQPAQQHAAGAEVHEQQTAEDKGGRRGQARDDARSGESEKDHHRRCAAGRDNQRRARPHVADHRAVEADAGEHRNAGDHGCQHRLAGGGGRYEPAAVLERKREVHHQRNAQRIRTEHDQPLAATRQAQERGEAPVDPGAIFGFILHGSHPCRPALLAQVSPRCSRSSVGLCIASGTCPGTCRPAPLRQSITPLPCLSATAAQT